jgi:hypothetical protein
MSDRRTANSSLAEPQPRSAHRPFLCDDSFDAVEVQRCISVYSAESAPLLGLPGSTDMFGSRFRPAAAPDLFDNERQRDARSLFNKIAPQFIDESHQITRNHAPPRCQPAGSCRIFSPDSSGGEIAVSSADFKNALTVS